MKRWYDLIIIVIFLLFSVFVYAAPAFPGLVTMTQPDGKEISIYLRGDEKIHWMESPEGYSLMYDKDKYIVFATTDEAGNMVPSSIVFQNNQLRSSDTNKELENIPKNLRYSASQISALREIRNVTNAATERAALRAATGTIIRSVCTLVAFPDKPLTKTKADFENLLNQSGYSLNGARGSVHDFFLEDSYGKLDIEVTVVDGFTAKNGFSYYGTNNSATDIDSKAQELAVEVADYTFSQYFKPADIEKFDNDNDGSIDVFHFIYAGYGEEAGAPANTIWAHKSGFYTTRSYGSKKLYAYSCSPELRGTSGTNITNIGVICHEMGHLFGSPDFYDVDDATGGSFLGTGKWDLMAGGMWNGPSNGGSSPAHTNMYQKIKNGWITPITLSVPQAVANMPNSANNAVAYKIDNPSDAGEYYVLENRQKTGFDSYVPGTGLLIYHVSITNRDISNNQVNTAYPQKVYPVCASSTYVTPDMTPASYGAINSAGCTFPGTSKKTSFTDYTTPSSIWWKQDAYTIKKPITDISESTDGIISFQFMMPGAEAVLNFNLTKDGNNVNLTWDKPNANVSGYNIYRDDRLIIKLLGANNTSYTQKNVGSGNHNYCATAFYAQNEESTPICRSISITGDTIYPVINNLKATVNGNTVNLSWDPPSGAGLGGGETGALDNYSVYRNNIWLNDVTTNSYQDIVPAGSQNGNQIYSVSAVYGGHESEWTSVQTTVGGGMGIAGINPRETIKVYPNPIKQGDFITIEAGIDFTTAKFSFYSVSGQLLQEATVTEPVYRQKISFAPGIYILQIKKDTQVITRKIVVK